MQLDVFCKSLKGLLHDDSHRPIEPERARAELAKIEALVLTLAGKKSLPLVVEMPRGYKAILTFMACMKHAVTYSPILPTWPVERKRQILSILGDPFVIDEAAYDKAQCDVPAPPKAHQPVRHSTAYIIFTSGTTGEPKGVMISRSALANFFHWVNGFFPYVTAKDTHLLVADLTFDLSVLDIALFMTRDTALKFSSFDGNPFKLAAELEENNITVLNSVPNNINLLGAADMHNRCDLSRIKLLLLGGARFSQSTYRYARDCFHGNPRVFNFYGPTETTVYSHVHEIIFDRSSDAPPATIPVGRDITGVTSGILDADGSICRTPGLCGEIVIGGVQVMDGYVRDEQRTHAAILNSNGIRYYKTGDLGHFDDEGLLIVTGRVDETIKRRGYRVNLLDIDSYIQRLPGVQDCVTVALPDAAVEHRLITFLKANDPNLQSYIDRELKGILLDYQIPDELRFVTHFPINSSGKVSKRLLIETYLSGAAKMNTNKSRESA